MSPSAPAPKSIHDAPAERMIGRVVRPHRRRPDPQVPVEPVRHGGRVGRPRHALRPDRPVRPAVHFVHLADRAVLDPLLDQADALARAPLVAHLGDDLVLARGLGQRPRLGHRARQRLLHVDVLAELHRRHRDDGVGVVRRRDDDGVDVLLLLEHHAEVLVADRVRERLEDLRRAASAERGLALVHVAQRDDVRPLRRRALVLLVPMPCT